MSTREVISVLQHAAELNLHDPLRFRQMIHLPTRGEVFVTGDLHNHRRNFEKFVKISALDIHPERHVILQELIHGGALGSQGEDRSLDMLVDAADWALQFPGQVHFLLSNHDLAQVHKTPISKEGYDLTERFARNFHVEYGSRAADVERAFCRFVYSMPLAAITVTGILLTHSLPGPRELKAFEPGILKRELIQGDYERGGAVARLIWGRNQTQAVLNKLSKDWWAEMFICGHQQQETGFGTIGDRMLILDSSHNHGVFLRIDLARQYTLQDLQKEIFPLAGVE